MRSCNVCNKEITNKKRYNHVRFGRNFHYSANDYEMCDECYEIFLKQFFSFVDEVRRKNDN